MEHAHYSQQGKLFHKQLLYVQGKAVADGLVAQVLARPVTQDENLFHHIFNIN